MSAKWVRSKKWDDEHIPAWAWPVKVLLRAFSSIPLAVVLLSLVVLYAIMASVPVGLIVLGLTYLFYGATVLIAIVLVAGMPTLLVRAWWKPRTPRGRAVRFAATVFGLIVLSAGAVELWHLLVWPRLVYDPAHGTGVRLFADFVERYRSTTFRRLPGVEMSELEFYSWWPLRLVLLLFVANMVTATVRRIEFNFPNLGVLTVHTGIVVIALGSVYYSGLKKEGDTLLRAGEPGADGRPTPGVPQSGFYDNTRTMLWARLDGGPWEQRPIQPPRYNDYNLLAAGGLAAQDVVRPKPAADLDGGRTLDDPAPPNARGTRIDPDIAFRIVGYASVAEPERVWLRADPPDAGKPNPVRFAELTARARENPEEAERTMSVPFFFLPDVPADRLGETEVFGLEYVVGMSEQRLGDLMAELPPGTRHALVVEVPGAEGREAFKGVFPIEIGKDVQVGDTGYTLRVTRLAPEPPFPIITPGYEKATSSVGIVRVVPPGADAEEAGKNAGYDRWVYHRYPEISQDLLDQLNERGMPARRSADPAIRISYIDASKLQAYLDELPDGTVRAIVRQPGGSARIIGPVQPGGFIEDIMPGLGIRLGDRWRHAVEIERPAPLPERERRNEDLGTHNKAMLAVEVTAGDGWTRTIWLPFTKYLMTGLGTEREIELPGGRRLQLAFGREWHPLPGFVLQLMDFQMIAYDHRGAPRDYQSLIRVVPHHEQDMKAAAFAPYTHITKLNAPLQAPFMWSESRSYAANVIGTLASRLHPRQFKFSQAGWDAQTWQQTQKLVDQGQLPRPYVQFTILGVGNNPGIHIVAFGGVLMSIGIPWAFYLKPLILKRRKAKLAAAVAAGTFKRPGDLPVRPSLAPQAAGAEA